MSNVFGFCKRDRKSSAATKMTRPKSRMQANISDYGLTKTGGEASDSANASAMSDEAELADGDVIAANEILEAITGLKDDFSERFDGVISAIDGVRKEISDCTECVTRAEVRISNTEDEVVTLQAKVRKLEHDKRELQDKAMDQEARSRHNNLRLVGLPEKTEGGDACGFLEKWIPESLGITTLTFAVFLERAHRIGPNQEPDAPPRAIIMRFLNDRDKVAVLRAARAKKQLLYKDKQVCFYQDLPQEEHKKQKSFDASRQRLRSLGIRHGMLIPAKMLVTYKDKTHTFGTATDVEEFIQKLQEGNGTG